MNSIQARAECPLLTGPSPMVTGRRHYDLEFVQMKRDRRGSHWKVLSGALAALPFSKNLNFKGGDLKSRASARRECGLDTGIRTLGPGWSMGPLAAPQQPLLRPTTSYHAGARSEPTGRSAWPISKRMLFCGHLQVAWRSLGSCKGQPWCRTR